MKINNLLEKLNSKMIFTRGTDCLVYFVEGINTINEDDFKKLGYYAVSDGINMIDFKENVMDDITFMYGVKSFSPPEYSNLADFYSEIGFYNDEVTEEQILKSFDVFLDRANYLNPRIYLGENGVTIKCENCYPGYKAFLNGVEYEVVDNYLINKREGELRMGKKDVDMAKLCTTLVTDMRYLFRDTEFNQSIDNWDVSNVVDMSGMFRDSKFNQPIENWDVSKVKNMQGIFSGSDFDQSIEKLELNNNLDENQMFW